MENVEIILKGLQENVANELGAAIGDIVKVLNESLDFRRMRRIIVTADFAGELRELTAQTASQSLITHTNEEYGSAVAKVMLLPHQEEFEIVPIISAEMVAPLLLPITEGDEETPTQGDNEAAFDATFHYLHHEFCHVHDDNKKIDALYDVMLHQSYTGKDIFVRPLAEVVWSEYFANRMSSASATESVVSDIATSLKDAIVRTKPLIDKEILSYRDHADLQQLMALFQRHGEFLVKVGAYTLGYVDGLDKKLAELLPEAAQKLDGSYFERTWHDMHQALRAMYEVYPTGWKSLEVYDQLATAMESYYVRMGLVLSTTEGGGTYVHIPFRPETTPQ